MIIDLEEPKRLKNLGNYSSKHRFIVYFPIKNILVIEYANLTLLWSYFDTINGVWWEPLTKSNLTEEEKELAQFLRNNNRS